MSRIAKKPIIIPHGIEVTLNSPCITIKGKNATLIRIVHKAVEMNLLNNKIIFSPRKNFINAWAHTGTARSLVNGMIIGISKGFTKKLELVGIGYRVTNNNNVIYLSVGLSNQIQYKLPPGINVNCPSQTEIILTGFDKQLIGQVAAEIRAYRPPEPYKGKGIRYVNEIIHIKETKKK